MRRRTVLGALGAAGSLALAGCLGFDLDSGDSTEGNAGDGAGGDGAGDEADSDHSGGDNGATGGGSDSNGNSTGDEGSGDDVEDEDRNTSESGTTGDDSGSEEGDTGSGEPSLSVSVDPGQTERRNDYSLTVDGVGSPDGATVGELAVQFDEDSGIEQFVLRTVRTQDVGLTAAGVDLGVDTVEMGETRELLISPVEAVSLSDIEGAVVVTIERLRAPTPGEFSLSLALRTGAGESVTELDGTYQISQPA